MSNEDPVITQNQEFTTNSDESNIVPASDSPVEILQDNQEHLISISNEQNSGEPESPDSLMSIPQEQIDIQVPQENVSIEENIQAVPVQEELPATEIIQENIIESNNVQAEIPQIEPAAIESNTESAPTPANQTPIVSTGTYHTDLSELPSEKNDDKPNTNEAKHARQTHFEAVFNKLKECYDKSESITVEVKNRIKGGLRVFYEEMPLFLPTSHFSLKRNPSEEELLDTVGKNVVVKIHELQEYDDNRKTVIVSRKPILIDELWDNLKVGDVVEGKISSIASFGVFIDIGGLEGLVHVSRLSQVHIDNPGKVFKKGENLKAVIIELDKEKNRIALSHKELEKSPWDNLEQDFNLNSEYNGIIRRFTEFGAYIELKPGIDGLLRTSEISWTKRVRRPSEVFKIGQEIPVQIMAISPENHTITLSYKKTQPNPWSELIQKYTVAKEFQGIVMQVVQQGLIIRLENEVDGFLPRSKMKEHLKGSKRIPFKSGDKVVVEIADINPDEESLILSLKEEEEAQQQPIPEYNKPQRHNNSGNDSSKHQNKQQTTSNGGTFTLLDLISDSQKKNLMKTLP